MKYKIYFKKNRDELIRFYGNIRYQCQNKRKKARNLTIPVSMLSVRRKVYRFVKMKSFSPKVSSCMDSENEKVACVKGFFSFI